MRAKWILFILCNIILSIYFINHRPGHQSNSRVLPVLSWLQYEHTHIDHMHKKTIDKAYINGHYYGEKAPLTSLLLGSVATVISKFYAFDTNNEQLLKQLTFLAAILCGSLPFLLLLLFFAKNFYTRYGRHGLAYAMLLVYSLNAFVYAGGVWGHLWTAVLLVLSHISITQKRPFRAGITAAIGVCASYPLALAVVIYGLMLLVFRKFRELCFYTFGAFIPILALALYHWSYTGHPFIPLYKFVSNPRFQQAMEANYGMKLPSLRVLWELSFGTYRGVLFYNLCLIVFLFLAIHCFSYKKIKQSLNKNPYNMAGVLSILSLFLLNSSYDFWWGGWCTGPRHLIPATALLTYMFAHKVIDYSKISKIALFGMCGLGILFNWSVKAVFPIYSAKDKMILSDFIFPYFKRGHFKSWNIGHNLLELSSYAGVILWLILFSVVILILIWPKLFAKKPPTLNS